MSRTHNVFTLDAFTHKFPKQNFVTLNPVTHNILSHTQLSPTRLSHPHNCHTHAHTRNSVTFNSHARFVTRLSPSYNVMPYATPVFAKGELVILRSKNALVLDTVFLFSGFDNPYSVSPSNLSNLQKPAFACLVSDHHLLQSHACLSSSTDLLGHFPPPSVGSDISGPSTHNVPLTYGLRYLDVTLKSLMYEYIH